MRLFDTHRAPNPRRARWVMAEKGIDDIEIVEISVIKGEHHTPDHVARAGLATVPVLELDDGTAITESVAICRYLESLYPEPNLFGRHAREVAEIEMWTRRAEMMLATPLMLAVRHDPPALAAIETQVPEVAAANREAAIRAVSIFDRRLGESEFLAGGRITMADIVAIIGLDFARLIRFELPAEAANLDRWAANMRVRPAATHGG